MQRSARNPIHPGSAILKRPGHAEWLPVVAILAAVIWWGGSFSAMRVLLRALSPWSVMWLRMVIALALLLPFAGRLLPRGNYRKGDWKLLIPMVLFQPCLYFLLEAYALCYTTSSQAGVIASLVPLLVAVGAWMVLGEAIGAKTVSGLLIAMLGVAALTLLQGGPGSATNPLLGNIMELGAMTSAAANILIVKRLSSRYNPWSLTAMQTAAGALFFSPGLVFLVQNDAMTWTAQSVAAICFLGAFVTLGAFGCYNWGMSRIPASRASAFINLVPVFALLFGWLFLDELLSAPQWLAAVAVIGGVLLSQSKARAGSVSEAAAINPSAATR